MFGLFTSSKVKNLIVSLDTTDMEAWSEAVNDLARLGSKATPLLVEELEHHLQEARSPDILVVIGRFPPIIKNCHVGELVQLKPGEQVKPEFTHRVYISPEESMAENIVAVGKNRQYGIVKALGEIRDQRALSVLMTALKDNNSFVSSGAASALGRLGNSQAVESLLSVAEKGDESWRTIAAIQALGETGEVRAIEPLRRIMDSQQADDKVREACRKAIDRLGGAA